MTKAVWTKISTAAAVVALSAFAATDVAAQNIDNRSITVTVNVAGRATLTLGPNVVFNDADPDTTPTLMSGGLPITVKARTAPNAGVTLTVAASGDLTAGPGVTIPIANLSWSSPSAGFVAGVANTAAQAVGSWTGPGARNGTVVFSLVNSWAYAIGTYTATLNYTLTAP